MSAIPPKVCFALLHEDDLLNAPDPEWLVDGLLQVDSTAVLYGPPGIGKSFLALDLALSVATGLPLLGKAVKGGKVLYIAAEGARGLKKRVKAWKSTHQVAHAPNFLYLPNVVNMIDTRQVSELLKHMEVEQPLRLVVIDTLARSMSGGDENNSRDMSAFNEAVDRLRRQSGATILSVHHTGWDKKHERGSTALRGAIDTMLAMSESAGHLVVTCEKQKDDERFSAITIRLAKVGDSCVVQAITNSPDAVTNKSPATNKRAQCVTILGEFGPKGAPRAEWESACIQAGISSSTFERARKQCVGKEVVLKDKRYCLADQQPA